MSFYRIRYTDTYFIDVMPFICVFYSIKKHVNQSRDQSTKSVSDFHAEYLFIILKINLKLLFKNSNQKCTSLMIVDDRFSDTHLINKISSDKSFNT